MHRILATSGHVLGSPTPFVTLRTLSTDDIGIMIHI